MVRTEVDAVVGSGRPTSRGTTPVTAHRSSVGALVGLVITEEAGPVGDLAPQGLAVTVDEGYEVFRGLRRIVGEAVRCESATAQTGCLDPRRDLTNDGYAGLRASCGFEKSTLGSSSASGLLNLERALTAVSQPSLICGSLLDGLKEGRTITVNDKAVKTRRAATGGFATKVFIEKQGLCRVRRQRRLADGRFLPEPTEIH